MQKGSTLSLVLVGIVVIMAVAGGAYYFGKSQTFRPQPQNPVVSQTPQPSPSSSSLLPMVTKNNETLTPELQKQISPLDETANWKTYENSQSKYTLKYPSEWGFRDVDIKLFPQEDQKVRISYTAFSKVYQEKDNPYFGKGLETPNGDPLLSVKKTEGKTLQQITEDFKKSVTESKGKIKRSEVRTIDNTKVVLIVTSTEFADPKPSYFDYYFVKNQQVYEYSYRSRDESPVPIPETILSTFKFNP